MSVPVSELLRSKAAAVITVDESTTVYQAIEAMDQHRIGCVLVTDGLDLSGIFTERDYLRRIVLQGRTSRTTLVGEVLTRDVVTVEPDATLDSCMALMTEKRIRHLPVMKGRRLVGIVSIGDLVKHVYEETRERATQLERLVSGQYPG